MFSTFRWASATAALIVFAGFGTASAGPDPSAKCEAAKLKETGKLALCTLKSLSKSAKLGEPTDTAALAECETKFAAKLTTAEAKAEGQCPTSGDAAALAQEVAGLSSRIGDNVSGDRFIDNGNGTVTDTELGVIWQQQVAGTGCANCVDENRSFGGLLTWLGGLNGSSSATGLGGYRDWGLPTIEELQSIVDCAELPCSFVSAALGPDPTPPAVGQTLLVSGTTSTLPLSTIPCFMVVVLDDGTTDCLDETVLNGSSRARVMNNAR